MKPKAMPHRPMFSSGPCAKRPGWSTSVLEPAIIGRSHRSTPAKAKLKLLIDKSKIWGKLGVIVVRGTLKINQDLAVSGDAYIMIQADTLSTLANHTI